MLAACTPPTTWKPSSDEGYPREYADVLETLATHCYFLRFTVTMG
jgi:hypothetical protein